MKRVVFVHPAIRSYRAKLFERLARYNVEFLFTSVNDVNTPAGIETERLLRDTSINYYQCRELPFWGRKNFSFDLWRVFKYDIVIFSCATSIPFLLLSFPLKLLGKRIILFDELWKYPENIKIYDLIRPYIRFLAKSTVNGYVAAGSKAAQYMQDEYGAKTSVVHIAYNTTCIDFQCSSALKHSDQFAKLEKNITNFNRPVILYLGRLVKYKGLDVLIKAFSGLQVDASMLVVGDGPFRQECEDLSHSLGLSKKIKFWGSCDINDATCFYEIADIFVLPTRFLHGEAVGYESWGFTINEAMANGLPVIASDAVGAAFDLIKHGQTGWIFQAENILQLQEILNRALSNLDALKMIKSNGINHVEQKCSYQQNEDAIFKAIESVV